MDQDIKLFDPGGPCRRRQVFRDIHGRDVLGLDLDESGLDVDYEEGVCGSIDLLCRHVFDLVGFAIEH
jgi:hypothetical protein